MGGVQSQVMKQVAESFNQNILNQVSNVVNENRQTCSTLQSSIITFGVGCPPEAPFQNFGTISQTVDLSSQQQCNLTSQTSVELTNNLQTIVENAIDQTLSQDSEAVQEWFTVSFGAQFNFAEEKQRISNEIITNLNFNTTSICTNTSLISQTGGTNYCGANYGDIRVDIREQTQQTAVATCIAGFVYNTIRNDEFLNNLIQDADQQLFLKQEGLNLGIIIGVIVGVIVLLALILGLYYGLKGANKKKKSVNSGGISETPASGTKEIKA